MKTASTMNKFFTPLKAWSFAVLVAFSFNAHAEYYYAEGAPCGTSPKCVSVKRYHCQRHAYHPCYYPRKHKVKRYYYRPVVRYYEYIPPTVTCGGGCGCNNDCYAYSPDYYTTYTRYAYVCNDCEDNLWVPGYMCHGRWVSGHWRY